MFNNSVYMFIGFNQAIYDNFVFIYKILSLIELDVTYFV